MFRNLARLILVLLSSLPWLAVGLLISKADVPNWFDFIFGWPDRHGTAGGIFPFLVNSLVIVSSALGLAALTAFPAALVYSMTALHHSVLARGVIELGAAVPRLIWGVVGSLFFGSVVGLGISAATGILTLACLLAPLLTTIFIDALAIQRDRLLLTCRALGLTDATSWFYIILPEARSGLALALKAGIARALSDAAALYLTAGATATLFSGFNAPASTLAVHILMMVLEIGGGQQHAFATALLLLGLVFLAQIPLILDQLKKGH